MEPKQQQLLRLRVNLFALTCGVFLPLDEAVVLWTVIVIVFGSDWRTGRMNLRPRIASWQCLWSELRRYFIIFEPLNFRSLWNENIPGKCFRSGLSYGNPRISPLTTCSRLSLLIITSSSETQQNRTEALFHSSLTSLGWGSADLGVI